jgi:hypothetical protein
MKLAGAADPEAALEDERKRNREAQSEHRKDNLEDPGLARAMALYRQWLTEKGLTDTRANWRKWEHNEEWKHYAPSESAHVRAVGHQPLPISTRSGSEKAVYDRVMFMVEKAEDEDQLRAIERHIAKVFPELARLATEAGLTGKGE